jgi:hypothetical protein
MNKENEKEKEKEIQDETIQKEKEREREKMNKELVLLGNIRELPNELIDSIYVFIPMKTKVFLSRTFYTYNHYLVRNYVSKGNMESYIRDTIRRDNDFVFFQILNENFIKWIFEIRNYKYKNIIFQNYLYFVKEFCLINESMKCRNVLNDFIKKHDLCKNEHKKNPRRNTRWRT